MWSFQFREGTDQSELCKGSRGEAAAFLDLPMSLARQVTEAQIQREGVRRQLDASGRLRERAGMETICRGASGVATQRGVFFQFARDCHSD